VKIGSAAVPALIENIENEDHDVRKFIVDVLGLIADARAVEALSQRLGDENVNVVCASAEALGRVGSPRAVDSLIAVTDQAPDAVLPAIEALGKIRDPRALDYLYKCLESTDPMVMLVAIEAVGQIGQESSVARLAHYLESPDRTTSEAAMGAIIAITRHNDGRINFDLPLDRFTDFLFEGIRNRDHAITEFTLARLSHWYGSKVIAGLLDVVEVVEEEELKRITEMLVEVGPPVATMILKRLSQSTTAHQIRMLDIMAHLVDESTAAELLQYVHHEDPEIRQRVAHLLGASGFVGAIKSLKALASDTNGHVRAAAYAALGWLCSEDEADFIMGGLDDKYSDVREAAVGALVIIGGPRVVAKLTADLYHEDAERQRLAVTAIGWIGEQEVVGPLLKAINHPDAAVRKSAINSLIRIGVVEDVEPILLALSDENSGVRKTAVTALLALRGVDVIKQIAVLLEDDDVWVRYHTISSIGDMGRPELAEYVIPALQDDLDIIKLAAAKALARMGCREAVPILSELKDDKNRDLADIAEMAIDSIGGKRS
jgi:HEAT repeat protein